MYSECLVCGKPSQVGHHYYSKGSCSALRYDINNIVPLCHGCHMGIHTRCDPEIQNTINEVKGKEWLEELRVKKRNSFVKTNMEYYENMEKKLKLLTPYKLK